jgi:hypothetical protein
VNGFSSSSENLLHGTQPRSNLESTWRIACPLFYTDKKENKISLIYREIQMGAVAKSYMRKGFLIYEEMRKYLTIYEEAVIVT